MNRIVRRHVPAGTLPEELRGDIDPSAPVTVTVEEESEPMSREQLLKLADGVRRHADTSVTVEDAVARIRALRDEWDD